MTNRFIRSFIYSLLRKICRNTKISAPINASSVRKILILRYDRLGDMVVSLPMIDLLHSQIPTAEIHVLGSPRNSGLIEGDARIKKIHVWNGKNGSLISLAKKIRREKYDLMICVVFFKMTYAGLIANIMGGRRPIKITLAYNEARRAAQYDTWFNLQIPVQYLQKTMTETLIDFACGIFGWEDIRRNIARHIHFNIALNDSVQNIAINYFSNTAINKTIVLYNISAGKEYRQWSPEKNIEFVSMLLQSFDDIHLVVNATTNERTTAETLQRLHPDNISILPLTNDIKEICAYIQHVDIVITPDTSITHIATAFQKPIVLLCTPLSSDYMWMPVGVDYRSVYSPVGEPIESIALHSVLSAFQQLKSEYMRRLK